ncbi:tRNA (adenosine(37)-N6)-threonylcarbamoyltransferase complex ATPase subunit type 1 TsaE [Patescibacteria group bacterium]|nr:tRNA (adenosine(37)-N6)-threonylcarbamoyltransferase complex ATPase subunit type 1 TsaE [Patescibacteria group bacterium]
MRTVTITSKTWNETFTVPTAEDWASIAKEVARHLKPGSILALQGELGAGKTTFTQALAKELGVAKVPQSPTFALMRSYEVPNYEGIKRLIHVDAYRLEDEKELMVLDLDEELADGESVLVVEWPEKIRKWLDGHMESIHFLNINTP